MYCVAATAVALLYIFWDVNYFLRLAFTIGVGRLFGRRCGVRDVTSIYGICTTQDVDIFLRHMNNARYVRELDFARMHFYDATGIYAAIRAAGGSVLQGAASVRYRRPIPLLSAYRVDTRLVYWEDKELFIEQQFVTVSDGFVRAVVLSRQNLVGADAAALLADAGAAPPCPEELRHWLRAVEVSSARLRKKD